MLEGSTEDETSVEVVSVSTDEETGRRLVVVAVKSQLANVEESKTSPVASCTREGTLILDWGLCVELKMNI